MSFYRENPGAQYSNEDPDDYEYDKVDYENEITDDKERAHEGLLRQEDQPRAPRKKSYIQTLTNMMKPEVKKEPAQPRVRDHRGPYQRLLSDESLDALSPKVSSSFGRAMIEHSESVKGRTKENIKALEAVLAKVPGGQPHLDDQIAHILNNERLNHQELETMVNYSEQLKKGQFSVRNGMMGMSADSKKKKKN